MRNNNMSLDYFVVLKNEIGGRQKRWNQIKEDADEKCVTKCCTREILDDGTMYSITPQGL